MENLQYPIGKYEEQPFSEQQKKRWLADIAQLPNMLEGSITNLDEPQLHTAYRPGGWTVHQLVHHVADSHINAFCRMKLTLTEENPTIKPYEQDLWVQQADVALPINISLTLLHSLHFRMYALLSAVKEGGWQRTYFHPETKKQFTLWYLLGSYAWHGRHHVAQITGLRERKGW